MQTNLIFGPPGTGKTTKLLSILEELLKTYKKEEIAFVSYTREGVNQGKKRAKEKFGGSDKDYPYFRTLHSLAFFSLGAKQNEMVQKSHYREFSKKLGMYFTGYYTEDLKHNDDKYLFLQDLHRNNPSATRTHLDSVDISKYNFVKHNYKRFKDHMKLRDYTDLIEQFIDNGEAVPVKVAIVDEAQDLSSLQWRMIWAAFKHVDTIYVAGDDDQAIYQWSGADVNYFLELDGDIEILRQSYRLPRAVLNLSKNITKLISKRVEKHYESTGKDGAVYTMNNLKGLPLDNCESWMFLSRNNTFLNGVKEMLEDGGYPYRYKGSPSITQEDLNMVQLYEQAQKTLIVSDKDDLKLRRVLEEHFSFKQPWWMSFKWEAAKKTHIRNFVTKGRVLNDYTIEVNTIHATKGSEADNVVLLLNITKQVHENLNKNPDSEHRVFYVGVTRAKKNLYLVHSDTKYEYKIYR